MTIKKFEHNHKIVIITSFYNVIDYIMECYDSIINQKYENFEAIFIDDASTDGTSELISGLNHKVSVIKNKERLYILKNQYSILSQREFNDEDIIVLLDGDDILLHDEVLDLVNYIYSTKNCLVCYGQYCDNIGTYGWSSPYTREEFKNLRWLKFRAHHLKTFKYKVYREFLIQDPCVRSYIDIETGDIFKITGDVALMHPLLEIAGFDRVYYNPEPVYLYRVHKNNDYMIFGKLQSDAEGRINSYPAFKQVF